MAKIASAWLAKRLKSLKRFDYFLIIVIVLASFLRFWNLEGNLLFQGDQGRDAIIVSRIFKEADLVFIGPVTSVGNMYLGPLYYYFMLPFLFLSYPSPLGPAYAVALLGVIAVFLMYRMGRELVGERAALMGAAFLALSKTVIVHSRFSWNPNPEPLVSLILIYATFKAWRQNPKYWVVVWICFAILIQLHYTTLTMGVGFGIVWLVQVAGLWRRGKKSKSVARISGLKTMVLANVAGFLILLASLTPLVLFDARNNWANAQALQKLITVEDSFKQKEQTFSEKAFKTVRELQGRSLHIVWEVSVGRQYQVNVLLIIGFIGVLGFILAQGKKRPTFYGEVVLVVFLMTGLIGTSLYEYSVFDHYIAYLFPVTFLLYGVVFGFLGKKHRLGNLVGLAFFVWFLAYNIPRYPLADSGWTIADVKRTTDTITQRVMPGEKYNIVLLSESRDLYGQNYRYFLTTVEDKEPLSPEQGHEAEKLFIINEEKQTLTPQELPIYEIQVFPNKTPVEVYDIEGGPQITVLER